MRECPGFERELMKTFTVTIHNSTNYGAWLQTYALQNAIQSLGAENIVMDYTYEKSDIKQSFSSPKQFLVYVCYRAVALIRLKKIKKRKQSFMRFAEKHICMSEPYHSMDELRKNPPQADVYITGSDQVWNFLQREPFLESRFLDFGSDSVKRMSYAASISDLNYSNEQKDWVREKLSLFDAISLRESSASEYLSTILGKETSTVLDPVFLLEKSEWEKLAVQRITDRPYILCYQVQSCPGISDTVSELKRRTGYTTISILPSAITWIKTDISLFDVSPEEFVGLFLNASIIVSASFHGTAFGLISGKPTYALTRSSGSSRIEDLMSFFGVREFCVKPGNELVSHESYDASAVEERIKTERDRSIDFLRDCLDE